MSHSDRHDPPDGDRREQDVNRPGDGIPAGRLDGHRVIPDLTHEDFKTMPIEDLADRTGLKPPKGDSPAEEHAWREKAWQGHVKDLEHRDEWGTATQATEPPTGDDPNL